jgi:SNF2 family DNA or RNA helicase
MVSKHDLLGAHPGNDFSDRIKSLRADLSLTQQALAERLGVSFATVNRWENSQSKPSQLSWHQLRQLETDSGEESTPIPSQGPEQPAPPLDFTANPEIVKVLAEGERLCFGHLVNSTFGTEISKIDPLPHQRIAVYDHMLKQPRLRFLLADDAGAGKTIMSGLYIREMLSRRLLKRILIVAPAGLVGNWRRELLTLFSLPFRIVAGNDARTGNPFIGENSDCIIISIDTLASSRVFNRLREEGVIPYDLVIFDEAHKLSADRGNDLRVRKTDRYRVAEAITGIPDRNGPWHLSWKAHHLLFLTATPHMGKEYPYYALWHLLQPEVLSTPDAFAQYPPDQRANHFIRRTKEEMVYFDGRPIYPPRLSDTLGYDLSQGDISEQALYDEVTEYLRDVYNRAKLLNREAARLAMSVFQRRLASSTWALLRSLERRIEKLDVLIEDIQVGKITTEQMITLQHRIHEEDDMLNATTADEEESQEGKEGNELAEDKLLQGVVASSLADLLAERGEVKRILDLAKQVYGSGHESKFDKLREIFSDQKYEGEKFIVFTEHRDTLQFLVSRLAGMGYTDQVAQIHGGMDYVQREAEVERFRDPVASGGARFLVCTDAAGEGINLQFCWIMINYDVPWNPARLEQRMGRIHRYNQKHDQVIILNLVAPKTREGKVLKTLLDKLEKIRKELNSDKVFDCIGRIFSGVSIRQYMELAVMEDSDAVARELDGRLTEDQITALDAREKSFYGSGGDVKKELPRLREDLDKEIYFRLLPGYVRQYIQEAAALVDINIEGDMNYIFSLRPSKRGAMDELLPALEAYGTAREHFTVLRPDDNKNVIWLHPGESVFERFRSLVSDRLASEAKRGAVLVDPTAEKPYLFHMAFLPVVRKADPEFQELAVEEVLECRPVGVKQYEGAEIELCPIEHLLLLKGGVGLPPSAQRLAVTAEGEKEHARAYLIERVAREMALERRKALLVALPERESFIKQGYDFQEAELAMIRAKHAEKARGGNRKAMEAVEDVKRQQRELSKRRETALAVLDREPDLVAPGPITFVAHALVVPSSDPADLERHLKDVEAAAMKIVSAFEEAEGATVMDVHTPELARKAGLPDNPGFDLLSIHENGERRSIEVKGRANTGDVEVSANEWAKACNMRQSYWLYAVYDCATPNPRLLRVQDPFGSLLARGKGSMLIGPQAIRNAAKDGR